MNYYLAGQVCFEEWCDICSMVLKQFKKYKEFVHSLSVSHMLLLTLKPICFSG